MQRKPAGVRSKISRYVRGAEPNRTVRCAQCRKNLNSCHPWRVSNRGISDPSAGVSIGHKSGQSSLILKNVASLAACVAHSRATRKSAASRTEAVSPVSALQRPNAGKTNRLPTTDGREIVLTRYTQPRPRELQLLINQLKLTLPSQPPPKITAAALAQITPRSEDLLV
jgi:hypothetical protein